MTDGLHSVLSFLFDFHVLSGKVRGEQRKIIHASFLPFMCLLASWVGGEMVQNPQITVTVECALIHWQLPLTTPGFPSVKKRLKLVCSQVKKTFCGLYLLFPLHFLLSSGRDSVKGSHVYVSSHLNTSPPDQGFSQFINKEIEALGI